MSRFGHIRECRFPMLVGLREAFNPDDVPPDVPERERGYYPADSD